jgi:hypothetical protein
MGDFLLKTEAWTGFEPVNDSFANCCLSHLATRPTSIKKLRIKNWKINNHNIAEKFDLFKKNKTTTLLICC